MCSPVWQAMSPSKINFPINFNSVCAVCELMSAGSWILVLFVICHDRFEKIAEALVAAGVVLARHLHQQFLQRIQAAQRMPRDGVSQARPQHDELLLPLVLRRADG